MESHLSGLAGNKEALILSKSFFLIPLTPLIKFAIAERQVKIEKRELVARLAKRPVNPPTHFVFVGKNPEDSEWDDEISSEEMQGIAHSQTNWFVSNKGLSITSL